MPWVLLLLLLGAGGAAAAAPASADFARGVARRIRFADGKSTLPRIAQLRAMFGAGAVRDEGNGVYAITSDRDQRVNVPAGSSVQGALAPEQGNRWHAIRYRWGQTTRWGTPFWTDKRTALELLPLGSELWGWFGGNWQKVW
jgi:hypothetical protein